MNYAQTTGRTIQEDFEEFHKEYPQVFEYFKKYLWQIIQAERKRGKKDAEIRTSSKMILNRIRWEITINGIDRLPGQSETNASNGKFNDFKINDAFTSRYARLFIEQICSRSEYKVWSKIFNQRTLRS